MKIRILHNPKKAWAIKAAKEAASYLIGKRNRICKTGADATVIIGGDGTVIHHKNEIEGILVGIGSKRSGICQLNKDGWKENIERVLHAKPEELSMLEARISGRKYEAINDIAIRGPDFRAIHTRISCECGEWGFFGDGINVCARLGSTGYNKSLFGPMLLKNDIVAIAPIAPILQQPNAIVMPFCKISVNCLESACCVIDGQHTVKIGRGMEIRKGRKILYGKA
jgi:NAD kinase